jgi:predicted ArsR family transcriptional regulator
MLGSIRNMLAKINIKKMHHRNGPDTERAAAHKVARSLKGRRREVLLSLYGMKEPATGEEISLAAGLNILSVRPRLTELQEMLLIEDTQIRRKNRFGNLEIVWSLTEEGKKIANQL